MKKLEGRPIIVTGGGSGIGKGACQCISEAGGLVGVADIRSELAEATAKEIRDAGGNAIAITCDVSKEDQVAAMVEKTVAEFGGLWGLASNAGTAGNGWIHETDISDWQKVIDVNLTGSFLCSKHAIPHMMEGGGGSIVMTSSVAGTIIGPGGAAASYAASKHGVIGLAKQVAVDYGAWNIRGNAIQPSGVEGANFAAHVLEDQEKQQTPRAELPRGKKFVPMQRRGKVREEYGATIAFLMTDDAGYITGAVLPIDGGFLSQ